MSPGKRRFVLVLSTKMNWELDAGHHQQEQLRRGDDRLCPPLTLACCAGTHRVKPAPLLFWGELGQPSSVRESLKYGSEVRSPQRGGDTQPTCLQGLRARDMRFEGGQGPWA